MCMVFKLSITFFRGITFLACYTEFKRVKCRIIKGGTPTDSHIPIRKDPWIVWTVNAITHILMSDAEADFTHTEVMRCDHGAEV